MVAVAVRSLVPVPDRWVRYFDPDDEPLGDLLLRLRKERGWSQTDLARLVARSDERVQSIASLINKYERGGVSKMSDDMAERLGDVLGVPARRIKYAAFAQAERQPIPPDSLIVGPVDPELRLVIETIARSDRVLRRVAEDVTRYDEEGALPLVSPIGAAELARQEEEIRAIEEEKEKSALRSDREHGDERAGA